MDFIDRNYIRVCTTPGDIHEHLPTLREYSQKCGVIAEMGVRNILSTWAFIKGLTESPNQLKKLICVDIQDTDVPKIIKNAADVGVELEFKKGNSATIDLGTRVDMLFIDTWHIYGHMKRELEHHHANVNKYIVMHDTTVDEFLGENIRMGMDIQTSVNESGYPASEITKGLGPAITEFLETHPEWKLEKKFTNNNGLTILVRV